MLMQRRHDFGDGAVADGDDDQVGVNWDGGQIVASQCIHACGQALRFGEVAAVDAVDGMVGGEGRCQLAGEAACTDKTDAHKADSIHKKPQHAQCAGQMQVAGAVIVCALAMIWSKHDG